MSRLTRSNLTWKIRLLNYWGKMGLPIKRYHRVKRGRLLFFLSRKWGRLQLAS